MDVPPPGAEPRDLCRQRRRDPRRLSTAESIILPQLGRPDRTMEIEYGLATVADHMHVRRPMVIGVDHHP
jgi:hypothetical protein